MSRREYLQEYLPCGGRRCDRLDHQRTLAHADAAARLVDIGNGRRAIADQIVTVVDEVRAGN